MKYTLLLVVSVFCSCTIPVRQVPSDIDLTKVITAINNQAQVISNHNDVLVEIIKKLQERGILPKPEVKTDIKETK